MHPSFEPGCWSAAATPAAARRRQLTGDSLPVPMIMDFQIIKAEVMIMPAGKTGQL